MRANGDSSKKVTDIYMNTMEQAIGECKMSTDVRKDGLRISGARVLEPDGESKRHGYPIEWLEKIVHAEIVVGNHVAMTVDSAVMLTENVFIVRPAELRDSRGRREVRDEDLRFWGLLALGEIAMTRDTIGDWLFWMSVDGQWETLLPMRAYGDDSRHGAGYAGLAWAAEQLGLGMILRTDATVVDEDVWTLDADADRLVKSHSDGTEYFRKIVTPAHSEQIVKLQREAFGELAFDGIAMTTAYLLLPARSQRYVLLEDDGGSGKTSWMHAFSSTWPGVACEKLSIDSLAKDGFTAGSALVPALGKTAAFCEEAGTVSRQIGTKLAELSTGSTFELRFGNSIAESRFIQLKLVIATNSVDDLDSSAPAVARRRSIVPMKSLHDEAWWRAPAGFSWSGNASRHAVIFGADGMNAMAAEGVRIYIQRDGVWPDAEATISRLSPAALEAIQDLLDRISDSPASNGEPITLEETYSSWPSSVKNSGYRRRIRTELKKVAGIGSVRVRLRDGSRVRVPAVTDAAKLNALATEYGEKIDEETTDRFEKIVADQRFDEHSTEEIKKIQEKLAQSAVERGWRSPSFDDVQRAWQDHHTEGADWYVSWAFNSLQW